MFLKTCATQPERWFSLGELGMQRKYLRSKKVELAIAGIANGFFYQEDH